MGIEGSEMHSEVTPDGNGNQSSTGHSDGSEFVGSYSETAEQPDLDTFRKALAESREEMAEDAKVRNTISTTFRDAFAELGEAVRNKLEVPDASERKLPSVQELAKAWGRSFLDGYRRISQYRQGLLYEHLAALPAGRRVLVEHLQALRPEAPLPPSIEDMPDQENLAALAIMSSQQFVLADAAYIEEVHRVWNRATYDLGIQTADGKPLKHPLAPMIDGWLLRPFDVELNRREYRILPSRLAQVQPNDRRATKLFSPAAHVALVNGELQVLPGFEVEHEGPALPLVLYDLGDPNPHRGGGRSAPLALRLFVEAILGVRLEDRRRLQPVSFELTLRELRERLYPGRNDMATKKVMNQLLRAVDALDSMDARIPWHDPTTGRGGLRRIVSVQDVPRSTAHLDDVVRVIVDLPPGADNGPVITPTLAEWGVRSGPAYRALINLAYRWWQPGVTHYPVPSRGGRHWVRNEDPSAYPEIMKSTLIELAFPTSANMQRRNLVGRARGVFAELEAAGELRIVDNRILPPGTDRRPD